MAINISKPSAQLPRNAFDLSQRNVFTSRVGLSIPALAIDCIPGDYHEINTLSLTRTLPLKTDAFAALKQDFSFVFVPYQQIWRFWNDFINQSQEHFSSLEGSISQGHRFDAYSPSRVPCFSLAKLIYRLHDLYRTIQDQQHENLRTDENGAGFYSYDYYVIIDGVLRLLDMLGYGSFYEYVYSDVEDNTDWDDIFPDVFPNMFRLCAYQKAWFDYQRNSIYDQGSVLSFNLDHYNTGTLEFDFTDLEDCIYRLRNWLSTTCTPVELEDALAPFILHNVQWNRDKFTTMYPQAQFGSVSGVSFEGVELTNGSSSDQAATAMVSSSNFANYPNALHSAGRTSPGQFKWSINNAFSVYELRYAQMLQRWKEDKMRAGKRTKDIAEAIFGEKPKYSMDQYSDFVDNFTDYINIQEVTSQSQTEGADLGQLAGKGVGASNHTVKFKTSDYGVLICLYSVTPNVEYNAYMLDKQNTMSTVETFYNPYFMDQGFEPITLGELAIVPQQDVLLPGAYNNNTVVGYAPHDQCYKQNINKVHGEFMSGRTLSHWVIPRTQLFKKIREQPYFGLAVEDMYVHPGDVDSIFTSQDQHFGYGNSVWYQEYDQFLNNMNFEVKSVRNLSVLGLPRW